MIIGGEICAPRANGQTILGRSYWYPYWRMMLALLSPYVLGVVEVLAQPLVKAFVVVLVLFDFP